VAGIVLGIVGMALLILGGVPIAAFLHSCSVNPANCG
jgi:hypothetical protein